MRNAVIVLPTYNEADNVANLIPRIFALQNLTEFCIKVLVVDDNSPDGTQAVVEKLKLEHEELHITTGPKRGLGEAYKRGFAYAFEYLDPELLFEMDADCQHDPSFIPLFIHLTEFGFSLIIGSRFAPGGDTPDFSAWRKFISISGNWMIRFFGGISRIQDCTSGYRCMKADIVRKCDLSGLSTRGYSFQSSLLFELLRNNARVIEVPIIFYDRKRGMSKLSFADQIEFLINIARIRFKQSKEFIKFAIVGLSGVIVNVGLYYALTRFARINEAYAQPVAVEASIITNFMFNQAWTFRRRNTANGTAGKFLQFHVIAGLAGVLNYGVFLFLLRYTGMFDLVANLCAIACGVIINYSLNSRWTWKTISQKI
ncbi:MAG: glycosyltransferase family 2 protein [Spirochaetales bacterium]|nr:glycosyltransferase family 2 protein [Spirochaetales bacterium]